jgi:hypothetical protein
MPMFLSTPLDMHPQVRTMTRPWQFDLVYQYPNPPKIRNKEIIGKTSSKQKMYKYVNSILFSQSHPVIITLNSDRTPFRLYEAIFSIRDHDIVLHGKISSGNKFRIAEAEAM